MVSTLMQERDYDSVILKHPKGHYLEVVPTYGGVTNRLVFQTARGPLCVLAGYTHRNAFEADTEYRNIPLFPLVNRLDQGRYSHAGTPYQFPVNEPSRHNALHGFIHHGNPNCECTSQGDTEILTLSYPYPGYLPHYPFTCHLEMQFTLHSAGKLTLEMSIANLHDSPIPITYGWHPYFCLNNEPVDNLALKLPNIQRIAVDNRLLPTGALVSDTRFSSLSSLENIALDNCFALDDINEGWAETQLWSNTLQQGIKIAQQTGDKRFNYLQVCTAQDRQSIAIEPISSPPNALANTQGLILLKPGEITSSSIEISLLDKTQDNI